MNTLTRFNIVGCLFLLLFASSLDAQVICNMPPENDFCRDAYEIDGTLLGITCCGEIEGFNLCGDLESGVWYYYDQAFSATLLEIENLNIEGGIGVEIYAGTCSSLRLLAQSDCTGFEERSYTVPNCNGRIFIHISTTNEGCGEFVVSMTDIQGCESADTCEEIGAGQQLAPISDGPQECISTCLEYSCLSTCANTNQSAWFQFNTDEFATAASILIDNADFEYNISVYRATNCSDLDAILQCVPTAQGSYTDIAVVPSSLYYVEVSLIGGNPGPFDACVSLTQDFIDCSYGSIEIIRTENPAANPNGPYCPGETVEVCYELTFNVDLINEGNGCQWLQGIVPVLGGGWDLSVNSLENQPLDEDWQWYDDVDYNVESPVLGLGTDPNGNKILEYGIGGLGVGDELPGGWWITSPAASGGGCVVDGHPDNSWGLQWPCGQSVTINHCFTMTAKSPENIADCDDAFQTDLSITLFTFADGETGCYDGQLACAGDTPISFHGKIDCSTLVEYNLADDEICSNGFASVPVSIEGGYEIPIIARVIDAGNTTGARDWIFETGSGLIPDQIINNGSSVETITYEVSFYEPTSDCNSPVETFEVKVHPEFTIPSYPPVELCDGETFELVAPTGHDAYQWFDAVTNQLISEDERLLVSAEGFYRLEVTEDFCKAKEIIEVIVEEPLPLAIAVSEINLCNNFIGTLPTAVDLSALQLNGVSGNWLDQNGNAVSDPGNVEFNGSNAGTLTYSFETNAAISPCLDTTYRVDLIIEDCQCPSVEINPIEDFCAIDNTINLDTYKVTTEPGNWTVTNGPDVNSIQINANELIISPSSIAGEYTLTFTITTPDVGPLCETTSEVAFEIFTQPSATIVPTGVACNEDTGTDPDFIDLDDFNPNDVSGLWTTTELGVTIDADNVVLFAGADARDYVFTFTTDSAELPCTNPSYNATITVQDCSCPSPEIGTLSNQCLDDINIDLATIKVTTELGTWSVSDGPDVSSISIIGDMMAITQNTIPGDYTLTFTLTDNNIGPNCPKTDDVQFSIFETPIADILPSGIACNEDTGTDPDIIDLDIYNVNNVSGTWSTSEGLAIDGDNVVDFRGADVRDYVFTFTTDNAMLPCIDPSYNTTITVNDCTCPSPEIDALPNQCLAESDVDLTSIKITTEPGEWTVSDGPDVSSISISGDIMSISMATIPGDYTLTFTLTDNNIGPNCPKTDDVQFSIFETPIADITPIGNACNEDTGTDPDFIDLDTYNVNGASGSWSTSEGLTINADNVVDFRGADVRDYVFTFTTDNAMLPCIDPSYNTTITVSDCTCPSVELSPLDNLCLEVQSIDLNTFKVTSEDGNWTIVDGPDVSSLDLVGAQLMIDENAVSGLYTLSFELADLNVGPDCEVSNTIQFEIIEKPEAVITQQVVACNEFTGAEPDFIDLDDLNINGVAGNWTSSDGLMIDSDNVVSFVAQPAQNYEFVFTTNTAIAPCSEVNYTALVSVKDCSCPSLVLAPANSFCQDDQMFNLNDLVLDADPGTWSMNAGVGDVPVIQNQMLVLSSNTDAGNYMLTYTLDDLNIPSNCLTFVEIPFSVNEQPNAEILTDAEVCNSFIGTLETSYDLDDFYVSGSSGSWVSTNGTITIDSDNVVQFENVAAGQYEFIYTTNTAIEPCDDVSYSAFVTVNECVCPIIQLATIDDLCNTDNTIDLLNLSTGSAPGEWSITSSNASSVPQINNQTEIIIDNNTEADAYVLTYTLTDSNIPSLCATSADVIFNILSEPEAIVLSDALACNIDGSTVASDIIDLDDMFQSGSDGEWSTITNIIINADNTISLNGVSPGDYIFTYTTNTAQFPCNDQSYDLKVAVENCVCPALAFTSSPSLCNDESAIDLNDLLLNGVGSGSWLQIDGPEMNGVNVSLFDVNGLMAGDYEFEYTLNEAVPSGCDQSGVVSISINAEPQLNVTPEITVCNQNSSQAPLCIDLNALVTGDNGSWIAPLSYTGDFSDIGNVCFDGVSAGTKMLFSFTTNTAVSPCANKTESLEVTVIDCTCPDIGVMDPGPMCGTSDMLNLSDLETTTTVPGSWAFISGPENINIGNTEIFNAVGVMGGNYLFEFTPTTTPESMCPQSSQIEIEVVVPLSAGTGNTIDFCQDIDLQIDLFNLLDDAQAGGTWSEISVEPSTDQSFDASLGTFQMMNQLPGTYEFKYEHLGSAPCPEGEALVTIIILENPIADAGVEAIITCGNQQVQLGGENLSMGPRLVYEWTEADGKTIDDPTAANPVIYEAGTYKVVVTDIIFGCTAEDEVVIGEDIGFPTFDTTVLPFDCENNEGGTIVVQNSTGGNGDYIYSIDGGLNWTEEAEFAGLPPGSYSIILQDANGCEATEAGIEINEQINLNINLGDDVEITYGENYYPLQVQTDALPEEIDSVIWEQDDVIVCAGDYETCSIIEVDPEGVNTFCVRVVDINGCEETDCVIIREILDVNVYIPNVFTPEISDFNNRFFVQTDENIQFVKSMRVFDRWGSHVFEGVEEHEANDPDFGWDGTWKNDLVQSGVYTYHIVVTDALGSDHEFAGSVTVLR